MIGCKIKYISINGELKSGGKLIKIKNKEKKSKTCLFLRNGTKYWPVKLSKNYFFYKEHVGSKSSIRNTFMTLKDFCDARDIIKNF